MEYTEKLKSTITNLNEELKTVNYNNKETVQKKIKLCEGLIEAWEKPLELKTIKEYHEGAKGIVGFEEFIEELAIYLQSARYLQKIGEIPDQKFYLLLGPPGIGKSYAARVITEALGKQFININCVSAFLSELVGWPQSYQAADCGRIAKLMSEKKDRAPVILFDEIDKCQDNAVLNTVSLLFDDTKNKTDFDDKFLQLNIPMDEVLFICTANNIKKLPNFVLSRCTKINIKVLSWEQRMKIAKMELDRSLKKYHLEIHRNRFRDDLLKKCLTEEWGIRGTKDNVQRIVQKFLALGLNEEERFDSKKIPTNLNNYDWKLINKKEHDHDCPATKNQPHKQGCECFFSEQVPGWVENMTNVFSQEPTKQVQGSGNEQNQKTEVKRGSEWIQTQVQVSNKKMLRNGKWHG